MATGGIGGKGKSESLGMEGRMAICLPEAVVIVIVVVFVVVVVVL